MNLFLVVEKNTKYQLGNIPWKVVIGFVNIPNSRIASLQIHNKPNIYLEIKSHNSIQSLICNHSFFPLLTKHALPSNTKMKYFQIQGYTYKLGDHKYSYGYFSQKGNKKMVLHFEYQVLNIKVKKDDEKEMFIQNMYMASFKGFVNRIFPDLVSDLQKSIKEKVGKINFMKKHMNVQNQQLDSRKLAYSADLSILLQQIQP